jgi:thioester reductase-like protein
MGAISLSFDFDDVVTLLTRRARECEGRVAFRYLETGEADGPSITWTYGDLANRARRVAGALSRSLSPGDSALLLFPPGLDFVAAFFGCLLAGVVAVPAYPPDPSRLKQTLPRLLAIVHDAEARAVLTVGEVHRMAGAFEAFAPEMATIPWLPVDELDPALAREANERTPDPDELAFLQYTSGSTGDPKGVMVTHANLIANQRMLNDKNKIAPGTVAVGWLPLFHDLGLIGNVLGCVYSGSEMTLFSPLAFLKDPMRWMRAVSALRCEISGGPDFAYDLCARKATEEDLRSLDLRCWKLAFSGGEPVRAATLDRFARVFGPAGFSRSAFFPGYGLAEATLYVASGAPELPPRRLSVDKAELTRGRVKVSSDERALTMVSSGVAVPGSTVLVVDPDLRRALAPGEVGEVWVHGAHVAAGYRRNKEATEVTFHGRIEGDERRFLRTGDLGFYWEDELYITGRAKDVIIVRGRNHYPQDIERTAEAVSPVLRPGCSAAFSVEKNGAERVVLVAEAKGDAAALMGLAATVRTAVAEHHELRLEDVVMIPPRTVPKTSSGKIQRSAAKNAYLAGSLEIVRASLVPPPLARASVPPQQDILPILLEEIRKVVESPDEVTPERSASTLGIDSAQVASVAGALEKRLGFEIPLEAFFGHTLAEVAGVLSMGKGAFEALRTVDLTSESELPEDVVPAVPHEPSSGPLFVTGATGFLGRYLLAELLRRSDRDVICLVRATDDAAALERVRAVLLAPEHAARVRALAGDLELPGFGLGQGRWEALAGSVSAIYHCGAQVHWSTPFAGLRAANVGSTVEVLRLAAKRNVAVHYVSSIGIFPFGATEQSWFPEEGELAGSEHLHIGYFQSKWVAEKVLETAKKRGFEVSVYRPGFISGDSRTGEEVNPESQLLFAFLRGCIALGAVPSLDKALDVVPVDYAASAIAALSLRPEAQGRAFNIINPSPMRQLACYETLRNLGYPLREAPYPAWRDLVLKLGEDGSTENPLARFKDYYRSVTEGRMKRFAQQTAQGLPVAVRNTKTFLREDVRCPPFDETLLTTYVRAYQKAGLLPEGAAPSAPRGGEIHFIDRYRREDERTGLLYSRGKEKQWDADKRIDWSLDLDPENPEELPDTGLPIHGSSVWNRMTLAERARARHHFQAWQVSQFMHGEQGALLCASKIVHQAPTLDAKLFAATQVMDEARHLEVYSRLLNDKFKLVYPVSPPLKKLLDDVLSDRRWDMTLLGMQVLVEGLALAAFSMIRDQSKNKLASTINAYVMADEARHVAFGKNTLKAHYAELSASEREEREQFVVEASYLLRDRFQGDEVWAELGLPTEECLKHIRDTGFARTYRSELFSRIVPVIKSIGLWGSTVQTAYRSMGVIGFAHVDIDALMKKDELNAEARV